MSRDVWWPLAMQLWNTEVRKTSFDFRLFYRPPLHYTTLLVELILRQFALRHWLGNRPIAFKVTFLNHAQGRSTTEWLTASSLYWKMFIEKFFIFHTGTCSWYIPHKLQTNAHTTKLSVSTMASAIPFIFTAYGRLLLLLSFMALLLFYLLIMPFNNLMRLFSVRWSRILHRFYSFSCIQTMYTVNGIIRALISFDLMNITLTPHRTICG